MTAFVLTRTAGRPRMFQRLRASLSAQDHPSVVHVVHAETGSTYASADYLITGPPASGGTAPWELHNHALLEVVRDLVRDGLQEPGWVTFMDDDDEYTSPASLSRMLALATDPDVMPIWRVERERGRLSPATWRGDLTSRDGRICWEAAAHHTNHIGLAPIDANDGADGRYWAALARHLQPVWLNEVLTRPQVGKGKGRRRDYA